MNSCSNTGEERGEEVFDRISATRCSQRQVTMLKMLKRQEQRENQEQGHVSTLLSGNSFL